MYATMHLGMDHVLAKLLLDAPPLPDALSLQTETQTLGTTWVQVTEAYEKRKAMLQRRREKEKSKKEAKRRDEASSAKKKEKKKEKKQLKEKDAKPKSKQKSKSKRSSSSDSGASPRGGRSSLTVKTETKSSHKKPGTSPRVLQVVSDAAVVKAEQSSAYEASVLKKLRKLPMCESVVFGSNKYKAIVKWMELDKGKDAGTSAQLMELLTTLQLEATTGKKRKPKLSRKRSSESLDDALRSEKRRNRKSPSGDRKRSLKQRAPYVDEDEVVYESGEEEEEAEYNGGYSDSDEAEFVPELNNSPPPEKPKKRAPARPAKKQKQVLQEKQEGTAISKADASPMTSKEQLAAVVAKIRADEVASVADTKYLSYEKKPETVKPGASPTSAIVLDDSDDEDDEQEESSAEEEEEESKDAQDQDSSTDDDNDLFDLNEEDVYVVEAILCVKEGRALLAAGGQRKESDLYLVKWDDYNELTWEPEENIPQRLIDMFRERERAKRACQYQIKVAHERREVTNVTTQVKEIIYMIQWSNQDTAVWESRTTLPIKTQVWLDKVLGVVPAAKKRRETKAAKQYIYQ